MQRYLAHRPVCLTHTLHSDMVLPARVADGSSSQTHMTLSTNTVHCFFLSGRLALPVLVFSLHFLVYSIWTKVI